MPPRRVPAADIKCRDRTGACRAALARDHRDAHESLEGKWTCARPWIAAIRGHREAASSLG
jgi:hypothetical protein